MVDVLNNKENIDEEFSTELELSNLKNEIISNVEIHDGDPINHCHTADEKVVVTPGDGKDNKEDQRLMEGRSVTEIGQDLHHIGPDDDFIYKAHPLHKVIIRTRRKRLTEDQQLDLNLAKVAKFYENDVVPRLLREHQGLDSKPDIKYPALVRELGNIKYKPDMDDIKAGYATPFCIYYKKFNYRESRRMVNDVVFQTLMAHENTHAWQYQMPKRDKQYKKTSRQFLDDAYIPDKGLKEMYGIAAPLYKFVEQEAVNREIRYKFWSELYDKLGRVPTIDELDEYINNSDVFDILRKYGNGYFKSGNKDRVNKIKKALIHVADNSVGDEGTALCS